VTVLGDDTITVAIGGKLEAGKAQPGRVVALEDFDNLTELRKLLQDLQLGATHEVVRSSAMVQLNRPNLVVSCGPRYRAAGSEPNWRRIVRQLSQQPHRCPVPHVSSESLTWTVKRHGRTSGYRRAREGRVRSLARYAFDVARGRSDHSRAMRRSFRFTPVRGR
jgi:hypothetical protein